MDPAMYRIHAGSPRASPYDAAMLLQAYDLITTIRTPQTAFGGQLSFTWEPLALLRLIFQRLLWQNHF